MSDHTITSPTRTWVFRTELRRSIKTAARIFWREHAAVLVFYLVLSLAVSWPTIPNFTTAITGLGPDGLHNLWMLWHTQQVVLGQQPLFSAPDLYYPQGITLLAHGLGPVTGIFALPFWFWGPEAAYNGALLVSLWLTGYCMYLLARGLGLGRGVALFAGVMLLTSPMCLAGIFGHLTKVFLGGPPLALLTLHHALNPQRSRWWALGVGLALLLTLLHSGYQFVFAVLSVACFTGVLWVTADWQVRGTVFQRSLLTAGGCLVVVGPLLLATVLVSRDPALAVSVPPSPKDTTDALALFTPSLYNWWSGEGVQAIWKSYGEEPSVERAVSLSWVGVLLCVAGLLGSQYRTTRSWVLFTLGCAVTALGPTLHWFGTTTFTPYDLVLPLPYMLLKELPGLDFMRAGGRFMMVGFVGLGIAASFGLAMLVQRFPRWQHLLVVGAIGLVLLENWPLPFPQQPLPSVPDFYRQLAHDPDHYGVFDLPIHTRYPIDNYVLASAAYQIFQMTHNKGIAAGYLSRTYAKPPALPTLMSTGVAGDLPQFQVNGAAANTFRYAQTLLARHDYRYVVWHKTLYPEPNGAVAWLQAVFGTQPPLVDNDQVRVYAVTPLTTATPSVTLELDTNWYAPEGRVGWWAQSPARLFIHAPAAQLAQLRVRLHAAYNPQEVTGVGRSSILNVQVEHTPPISVAMSHIQTSTIPFWLHAGSQTITFTLEAGNFRLADYGGLDVRPLSFAFHRLNLVTLDHPTLPSDITVNGQLQQGGQQEFMALHSAGWYDFESPTGVRWASSPSTLLLYSATEQQVQLELRPQWIYETDTTSIIGPRGTLFISTNTQPASPTTLLAGQLMTATLDLQSGWNTVAFTLEAGSFRPSDVIAGSTDVRDLSIAVKSINFVLPPEERKGK